MFKDKKVGKIALILGIIAVVSLTAAVGIFFWFSSPVMGQGRFFNNIDEEKSIPLGDIHTVSVSTASTDLYFMASGSDAIRAHFHGSISSSDRTKIPYLSAEKKGQELEIRIEWPSKIHLGFFSSRLRLDIELPSSYKGAVAVHTASGDVDIPELDLGSLSLKSASGDLSIKRLQVGDFSFESASGELKAAVLSSKHSRLRSVSGDAELKSLESDLDFSSTSGDLRIEYADFKNSIQGRTVSGDITIRLPKKAEFTLAANTVSGDIVCEFPITVQGRYKKNSLNGVVGRAGNEIELSTTSGDIRVLE